MTIDLSDNFNTHQAGKLNCDCDLVKSADLIEFKGNCMGNDDNVTNINEFKCNNYTENDSSDNCLNTKYDCNNDVGSNDEKCDTNTGSCTLSRDDNILACNFTRRTIKIKGFHHRDEEEIVNSKIEDDHTNSISSVSTINNIFLVFQLFLFINF